MILDYKPKTNSMGSPLFKRTLHLSLGFCALACVFFFLSVNKEPLNTTHSVPIELSVAEEEIDFNPTVTVPTATINETWSTVKVRRGDTLTGILKRFGVTAKEVYDIIHTNPSGYHLASLHPGQKLKLRLEDHQLMEINFTIEPGNDLMVFRTEDGFQVDQRQQPLEHRLSFGKGEIENSLFLSAKQAGLDQRLVTKMVEIFGWNIDFSLDLRPSDTFRVVFEEKCLEGERIQTGNILAAEIINNGKTYQAVRYTDAQGRTSYFSPDGYSMQQAFLRAPVNFTRISSHFGPRKHPILHKMRQHKGVDYAAPRGTPIQATSGGKVIFVGNKGGYGKVVKIKHGARYTTLYAHLSRFPKGFRVGKTVKQGELIGFVGSTGLATAPHLHYEFLIDGIHRNPVTVTLPKKDPIPSAHKEHFLAHAKQMVELLDKYDYQLQLAANE